VLDGNFAATGATHVYGFTPPADTAVDTNHRAHAEFWVQPVSAANGDGSSANVKIWVTDSGGTKILSSADQNNFKDGDNATNGPLNLTVPVTLGQQYYVFVQSTATSSKPATDYYFIEHFVGSYYYGITEAEGPTGTGGNDVIGSAQKLSTPTGGTAGTYFVDGDLSSATDVDWFEVDASTTAKTVYLSCTAGRRGSGITGFTATLYDATGTTAIATIGPEVLPPTLDLFKSKVTVPAGTTKAFLKINATGLSSTVTGTNYLCAVEYST
jgi:hypothetical protein